jgi:cytochrome c oxidase assembly protein subunit 15
LGVTNESGVLENAPRMTEHFTPRLGALLTSVVLVALGLMLLVSRGAAALRRLGGLLIAVDAAQVALGISLVLFHLPLPMAVAHNGVAALLLLLLVTLNHAVWTANEPA